MTKTIFFFLGIIITPLLIAQSNIESTIFGFKTSIPESWNESSRIEFDSEENESSYNFFISPMGKSELDNRLSIVARANGYANSLADVHLFERQRLHREYDNLMVIKETDNMLLVQTLINNEKYSILTLVNFQNGISYLVSFSYVNDEGNLKKASVEAFFNNIAFFVPQVDYSDLDNKINEAPEDAILYLKKAQRKFGFHNFEGGMTDCNELIKFFPMYGEAYYLRGYLHIALGDTISACRDFHASIKEDYAGEPELDEFCNTRRIAEALEEGREEDRNPFGDFDASANHLDYVDSIRKHEFIMLSFGGEPSPEIISNMGHINHLFALDFNQLDSIYMSETGIVKLYAFAIICVKFPKQINSEHKEILKSKGKIMVITRDQKNPHLMPAKEIASLMYQNVKDLEIDKKMQEKTEEVVKTFIVNFSKSPDSYQPISFEQFHIMQTTYGETLKTEKSSESYVIGHRYKIKDINGNSMECYNTFKFNHAFKINIIEGEESNTVWAFPPNIQDWLDKYGKALSDKDKKKLGILD